MPPRQQPTRFPRRGSVVIIVLWAIALAALVASSAQLFAYRQSMLGREELHRVQARWAARGGIESTIAVLALHTRQPFPDDAFALIRDMRFVAQEDFHNASYSVIHHADRRDWAGPMDEHSKININRADVSVLDLLEDITPDTVAAIADWLDEDDEPSMLGAERDWYAALSSPYEPRNGPIRTTAELELIAGVWPSLLRGEDWNLNNRLDQNEDDGARTLPEDEPDGEMDPWWSGYLTAYSVAAGATASGEPRIYLRRADPKDLADRCGLDEVQAETLIAFGQNDSNTLEQLITTPLSNIDSSGTVSEEKGEANPNVAPLTDQQLRSVLAECSIAPLYIRAPGKINLNTATPELIRDYLDLLGLEEDVIEEIIYIRDSRPEGITSILDLAEIPEITTSVLQDLAGIFTASSNVYTITSRGISQASGLEVEIIAIVDRSTLPIRILEYREQ